MIILGIETSCDDCSTALVQYQSHALQVLSLRTFQQTTIHEPYGGVVPEIASRSHLESILPVLDETFREAKLPWEAIDGIAVTNRPGLVGSLLVGVMTAKSLAYLLKKPLLALHHLEGHAASLFLDQSVQSLKYPLLLAIVSGGHTNLYWLEHSPETGSLEELPHQLLGRSRDDAAGEAFDKIAKMMGLPYPGGPVIEHYARQGNPQAFALPRPKIRSATGGPVTGKPSNKRTVHKAGIHNSTIDPPADLSTLHLGNYDFSFSGLKTAFSLVYEKIKDQTHAAIPLADLCASAQEAILDTLCQQIFAALETYPAKAIAIAGGVSANQALKKKLETSQLPIYAPKLRYCTDNGAMIAAAGAFRLARGKQLSSSELLHLHAIASSST